MKRNNKRKIILLIFFVLLIIIMIRAFINSTANKLVDITAVIVDYDKLVEDDAASLQAINEEQLGYSVTLPETINGKVVKKYIFEGEKIETVEEVKENIENEVETISEVTQESTVEEENLTEPNNEVSNEINENETENITSPEETKEEIEVQEEQKVETIEKLPGDKIYLTQDELESKMIKLIVSYDFIEKEDSKLYNKELSQDINEKKVSIKGYMPYNAGIKVTEVPKSEAESKINEGITDATSSVNLAVAYDIKIIVDEKEYEPEEFDEKVVVSITGFNNQSVNVWHIKNDNTVEKMDTTETTYETNSFSIYGVEVLEENENQSSETSQTPQEEPKNEIKVEDKNSTLLRVIRTEATNEDEIFTINDYNSDYSYYIGKNFTDNTSGNNSGTYTSSNLAKVTINYYGYGYVNNNANNTVKGRISVSETQDIVKHIRCVPIVNNRVSIELLDNPFMDKPGGYGFGGWKSSDGTITTDSNTNTQTISASASSEMTLNIYVNWASAKVVYVNPDEGADNVDTGLTEDSPFGSWGKACDYLYNNSTNRNNRELNIIVLTGPIDTSIHYTRPTYQTQVSDAEYTSSTTFSSGSSYLIATGQGAGSNAIITNGSNIGNTQLQSTNVSLGSFAEWTISRSGNGYTIRNNDSNRYYLAGRTSGGAGLTLSSSSFTWSYDSSNRSFYYTYTSGGGWRWSVIQELIIYIMIMDGL